MTDATNMTRAERRRAAREKEWTPHDPAVYQSLDPWRRLHLHTQSCPRCSTGLVAKRGCEWLSRFASENPQLITQVMEVLDDPPTA